VMSIDVNC